MPIELHGHRGARGLAPENTLEGFRAALANRIDFIEIDIGLSGDGHVVIHHDPALNPAIARLNGNWVTAHLPIHALTLAELQTYDVGRLAPGSRYAAQFQDQTPVDGARIPSLSELFAMPELAARPEIRLNIEIKTSPEAPGETAPHEAICDALLREIDAHDARACCRIQSFDWRNLAYLRSRAPNLEIGFLTPGKAELARRRNHDAAAADPANTWHAGHDVGRSADTLMSAITALGGRHWGPHFESVAAEDITTAHANGIAVNVWTVNAEADMERMIGLGVDAITTDYPDRAARILART